MKAKKYKIRIISRVLLGFLIPVAYSPAPGQTISISGYVYDSKSKESLADVTIWENKTKQSTTTNIYGFFNLSLDASAPGLPYKVLVSFVGYKKDTLVIQQAKDTIVNVLLESANTLGEVIITSGRTPIEEQKVSGVVEIPIAQIRTMPAMGGERDIIKAYQFMPGIQQGSEGKSSLIVRGGSNDQNLILLDGVPLYYINHLGGFVSLFNDDAINTSKIYKGGFPANYGGRLSSVMDVGMKDGSGEKLRGDISAGVISSKVLLEGPLKKDTSTFMVSGRRFMYDLIGRPVSKSLLNTAIGYTFYDLNIKWNYKFSGRNRLYCSVYNGDDKIISNYADKSTGTENKFAQKWGNTLFALRWNHLYGNAVWGNLIVAYTKYRFINSLSSKTGQDGNSFSSQYDFYSGIQDLSITKNLEIYLSDKMKFTAGASITRQLFEPCVTTVNAKENNETTLDTVLNKNNLSAIQSALYIEYRIKLNKLTVNAGVRVVAYAIQKNNFYYTEPRVQLHYALPHSSAIKASCTHMNQFIHLLTGNSEGMPVEFWVPATSKAAPGNSKQLSLSFVKTLFVKYDLSLELYKKNLSNLIAFKEGATYFSTNKNWEDKIENKGKGTVYGLEILLQKQIGKTTGWISYTLSKSTRTFTHINNGKTYPDIYDRRHQFNLVYTRKVNEKIDFAFNWVFQTGQPLDLPVARYTLPVSFNSTSSNPHLIYVYAEKNSLRMLPYHRLDVGINFKKVKRRGLRTWNISVYNVYNRMNPYYYYFSYYQVNGIWKARLMQKSLFPIMPSVNYSFRF
jgi:CarboxypepD_reg-like domain/TonB-dependent Receptor Plug Domain